VAFGLIIHADPASEQFFYFQDMLTCQYPGKRDGKKAKKKLKKAKDKWGGLSVGNRLTPVTAGLKIIPLNVIWIISA